MTLFETTTPAGVTASGLTKRFVVASAAVEDLSFSVSPGEIYCLLGGTGAGKTSVLRMLLGLLAPSGGRASVAGYDPTKQPIDARRVTTFITSAGTLSRSMSALHNLETFVRLAPSTRVFEKAHFVNALRLMGVPERAFQRNAAELPRDTLLSVWLAVAWLRETPVLMLDEPTVGIDTKAVARLQTYLYRFRERGQIVLITTADVLFASQVADRIGIMKRGQKSGEYARADVVSRSLTDLYAEYVGHSPRRHSLEHPTIPRRVL